MSGTVRQIGQIRGEEPHPDYESPVWHEDVMVYVADDGNIWLETKRAELDEDDANLYAALVLTPARATVLGAFLDKAQQYRWS
jgi:hypothetical protein